MNIWSDLIYIRGWTVKNLRQDRRVGRDLKGVIQSMEKWSDFRWGTRWEGKSLTECSEIDIFKGIASESPIIREVAFLVTHIVMVTHRNVIVWTDFPLPQFLIEVVSLSSCLANQLWTNCRIVSTGSGTSY
jgi:hypothetical protein